MPCQVVFFDHNCQNFIDLRIIIIIGTVVYSSNILRKESVQEIFMIFVVYILLCVSALSYKGCFISFTGSLVNSEKNHQLGRINYVTRTNFDFEQVFLDL